MSIAEDSQRGSIRRWASAVLLVSVVVAIAWPLLTTIGLGEAGYDRRSYPGITTGIVTTIARSITDMAGWLVAGSIVCAMMLIPIARSRELSLTGSFELRVLRVSSGWWALLSFAMVVVEAADANGIPLSDAISLDVLLYLVPATDYAMAWLVTAVAASTIFLLSTVAQQWRHLLIPLVFSVIGMLAPVVVGRILVGPNHDLGSDAGAIVTALSGLALGALVVLALRIAAGRGIPAITVRRAALLGLIVAPVIMLNELVVVWFTLAGAPLFGSLAGQISLIRLICFAVLSGLVFTVWRTTRRERSSPDNLAAASLSWLQPAVLIAASVALISMGAQVALTRFLTPQYYVETSISQVYLGFNVPDDPSTAVLFGQWRLNLLIAVIALAGVLSYAVAVRRLRQRGDDWPLGRTASWLFGWAVIVFMTSSGFGKYSAPDFGVHMIVHMSLNMVGPLFLVMGGALTLFLRASKPGTIAGPHAMITSALNSPALHRIYNPLIVFALFVGSYYALYLTAIFGNLIRYHWAHQAMNIHFLVAGYLFFGLAIGVDRTPRQLPHVGKLGFVFAAMPFHAFFGVALMSTSEIIAKDFYSYLELPWMDLEQSQRLGGGVAWAGSEIPLLIVVIALVAQWSRLDNREATRKDRHYDAGLDSEYDAYNDMLRSLSERERATPQPSSGDRA